MIMQVDPIEEYKTKACIVLGQLVYEYKLKAKVFLDSSMLPEAQNALDNAIKYNNLLKEI